MTQRKVAQTAGIAITMGRIAMGEPYTRNNAVNARPAPIIMPVIRLALLGPALDSIAAKPVMVSEDPLGVAFCSALGTRPSIPFPTP